MKLCPVCNKEHSNKKYCSRTCSNRGREISIETRNKISNTIRSNPDLMNKYKHNFDNVDRTKSGRKRIERTITKCAHCGNDIIPKRSNVINKYHSDCWLKASGGYRINSTRKIRTMYKGSQMDSGTELKFVKLLEKHNIKWIKNSDIGFNYTDSTGKDRLYYPDFYLPDYNKWIEIKGKYYIDELFYDKIKAYPDIEVIYHDDIKLPECTKQIYK